MIVKAELDLDDLFQRCNIPSEAEVVKVRNDKEGRKILLTLSIPDEFQEVINKMLPPLPLRK